MAHGIDPHSTNDGSERRRGLIRRFRDVFGDGCWQLVSMFEYVRLARTGADAELLADLDLAPRPADPNAECDPEVSQRLAAMAGRVGVDCGTVKDRRFVREMLLTCAACSAHARCRSWLQYAPRSEYPAFCPNAELFEAVLFGVLPTGHPYGTPRRLARAISRSSGLSEHDAAAAIRDYRCARDRVLDPSLMQTGSSGAVRMRGGPRAVIQAAVRSRHKPTTAHR